MGTKYNMGRHFRLLNGLRLSKTMVPVLCIMLSIAGCASPAIRNHTAGENEIEGSRESDDTQKDAKRREEGGQDVICSKTGWEYEDSAEAQDQDLDPLGRAYIEDGIFYNTDYGFTLDLSEGESVGGRYEIDGFSREEGMALVCYDREGSERYSVYMTEMADEVYEACEALDSAQAFGQWLTDMYESTMKEYGLEAEAEDFLVENAEDILLDGRMAYKLIIKTKAGLMTIQSTYIRYFIPDPENGRLIDFSRQFFPGLESEEDIKAYQEFVESLKWMEGQGICSYPSAP